MKKLPEIKYFEDTDSLAIDLAPGPGAYGRDIAPAIVGTFNSDGKLIGLEVLGEASKRYPELVESAKAGQSSSFPRSAAS